MRYLVAGQTNEVQVTPDTIYVKPLPDLVLDYFLPEEVYGDDPFTESVEPVVPFSLGVRVKNQGYGVARKLKIESAQPRIVENKLGLLVDSRIEGSEVNGRPATPSLLCDFGDIESNRSGVARWLMISTLSGRFVDFTANYTHGDELGGQLTSLICGQPRTHVLVHDVLVDLPGRDVVRDFLARDTDVLRVYESENADTLVNDVSGNSSITGSGERFTVNTVPSPGFIYIKLVDPLGGREQLKSTTRADGKILSLANAWLSQTWDRSGQHWDYQVNVFDGNNTAAWPYALVFEPTGPRTNRPPQLDPLRDWEINVGDFLSFPITAFDPDGDRLTFQLESGPTNAAVHPGSGLFRWRPGRHQAPTTNVIRVSVTDDGNPPKNAATNFTVVVLPAERFELAIGSTNVFAGESNSVPIVLKSDTALSNITFLLVAEESKLTNLVLQAIAPEVLAPPVLASQGSNLYALSFMVDPWRVQFAARTLARLGFESLPIQSSAIVPLTLEEVSGRQPGGDVVTNTLPRHGRVVVFANEPVLEIHQEPVFGLTLYGRPGGSYAIQSNINLAEGGQWADMVRIPLAERRQTFALKETNQPTFYRAYEFQADPPVLAWHELNSPVRSLVLFGKPGGSLRIESATDLNSPASWGLFGNLPLGVTNSWHLLTVTNSGEPARFFRAVGD